MPRREVQRRANIGDKELLTRTGAVDDRYCTTGEDMTLLVLEKSSACRFKVIVVLDDVVSDNHTSISPVDATNATFPVVS